MGGTKIGDNCILGSHLEVTRSSIGDRVKISHQGFVGDGRIHHDVVLGSGTVFAIGWITKKHHHHWPAHLYWLWYDDNCSL